MLNHEKNIYSQNGEDGIIEHIFNTIGTTNKVAAEIGVSAVSKATGAETNTQYLAEQGWKTYWFDCENVVEIPFDCTFTRKFLTADNVKQTFELLNIPKDLDLLSIDVDGNDYHLREALADYNPKVCIMEYNGCFNGTEEYIMPQNDSYRWHGQRDFGASLASYTKQADRLGYDLVYCTSEGVNAFFVRKDVNIFKPRTAQEAWIKLCWA